MNECFTSNYNDMTIELSGLYGWVILALCAIALIAGLVAIIVNLFLHIERQCKRRKILGKGEQITADADAKLVYLLEDVFSVDVAAELEQAIVDPFTSYECMELIYENIKFKMNNGREKQPDQSANDCVAR